jgi:uncharacterized protein involved in tellurium resistance
MSENHTAQHEGWDGQNRRADTQAPTQQQGINFDKTINLGHILTFAGFMIAGVGAWTTLDKRVTVIEERANFQAQIDRTQDATQAANMAVIKEALGEIKLQVARLGERLDGRTVP